MLHYRSLEAIQTSDAWLTIGSFDGVHRGHQAILRQLTTGAHAAGAPAVVLTFHPHPSVVLGRRQGPFMLTSPEERAEIMADFGVDIVITHPFTPEVAATSAEDFMQQLSNRLGLRRLLVGHDFALGRGRAGDVNTLRSLGERLGYTIEVVEPVKMGDAIISSSAVRAAIQDGDVSLAGKLLGRPYRLAGEVVHGDARGRALGFPTANLHIAPQRLIPRPGVYACRAHIPSGNWPAVTNIGYRPTFENQPALPRIETHLLDFDQDLYSQFIRLDFIVRLRDEQRFPNVQALIDQVHLDMERARQLLTAGPGIISQANLPK